jgi:hypothetical protein
MKPGKYFLMWNITTLAVNSFTVFAIILFYYMKREDAALWDVFQIYLDVSITTTDKITFMTPLFCIIVMHFFVVWGNFKVRHLLVEFYAYVTISMPSWAQTEGTLKHKMRFILTFWR